MRIPCRDGKARPLIAVGGSVALTFAAVFTGMSSNLPTDVTTHRYKRHRFPAEIIAHAVWLYFRFPLSLRHVEDLLADPCNDPSTSKGKAKFFTSGYARLVLDGVGHFPQREAAIQVGAAITRFLTEG
jgi:hypothetical protein